MTKSAYLTLDDGATATFTPETQIVITYTDDGLNLPGLVEKEWCQCLTDIVLGDKFSFQDMTVADLKLLCSFEPDLKNHDYAITAVYSDSVRICLALHKIEHTISTIAK